jgi:beta propeller repeat protein
MRRGLIVSLMAFITIVILNVSAPAQTTVTRITTNSYEDSFPSIKGDYVVWQGRDAAGDWEIFLYNANTGEGPVQITNNDYGDIAPHHQ